MVAYFTWSDWPLTTRELSSCHKKSRTVVCCNTSQTDHKDMELKKKKNRRRVTNKLLEQIGDLGNENKTSLDLTPASHLWSYDRASCPQITVNCVNLLLTQVNMSVAVSWEHNIIQTICKLLLDIEQLAIHFQSMTGFHSISFMCFMQASFMP